MVVYFAAVFWMSRNAPHDIPKLTAAKETSISMALPACIRRSEEDREMLHDTLLMATYETV